MLQGVENYLRYARRGKVKPAFIAELKPTIRSDELRSGDWPSAEAPSNVDLLHPTGELRLKPEEKATVEQPKCTLLKPFQRYLINAGQIIYAGSSFYNYVQTFTTPRAFRLAKIQIGLFNEEYGYKGQVIIRILTGFQVPKDHFMGRIYLSHAILENAKALYETRLDCSKDETNLANNNAFRTLAVDKNVWIPGGNKRCAITVTLAGGEGEKGSGISSPLQLRTAGGSEYQDGRLFTVTHVFPVYEDSGADMMFRLIAYGFRDSGSAKFYLDLGGSVAGLENELAITYRKPPGTSISFTGWESATGDFTGEESSMGSVDDGDGFSERYLKIQVDMGSPADRLDSPRLFSIRAQSMRKIRFCRAERHLFGHPSILAAPPEYSAEGRPLEGDSSIDDSRLVMTDPGDMVTDIFRNHGMINDQVKVYAGFEIKGFTENDFIPFRTLRVEDWEKDGAVFVIHCIDAQIQLKNAEYPIKVDPPGETEEVHFNLMRPGELVLALLECAQIRKSMIDIDSFTALDNYLVEGSDPWEFNLVLKSGDGIKEKISEIMIHVPGFLSLGKDGKWHAKWIDFGASPVASFTADQVRLQSTRHYPNIKESSNVIKLFYGGDGHKETDYQRAMIAGDSSSIEAQKELTIKVMTSEILPAERRDVAARIASRILALTKSGIQTVTAEGPLETAILELGDIVSVECDGYFRKGAATPNPLLCQVTRTAIVSDLTGIDFRFQKILDNEETPPGVESIDPPSNFQVVDGQDGSATWSFDASPDEPTVKTYELLERVNRLQDDWIIKKIIEADQSSSYQFVDEDFDDGTIYDFAVRAATAAGVKSELVILENIQITNVLLGPPSWELRPCVGGWGIYITEDEPGAVLYFVFKYNGNSGTWLMVGIILGGLFKIGGHYDHWITKPYGTEWGRFKVCSFDKWGFGPKSDEQAADSLPYQGTKLAADMTPGLPDESGTYPILTLISDDSGVFRYSVELKVTAPVGDEDLVARYELERRDNSGGDYGAWANVGVKIIDKWPATHSFLWENPDVQLKPGVTYQWQVQARAQDGTPSGWSDSLTKQIAGHSTPPDKPTIIIVQYALGLLIHISTPTEGGVPCGGHFGWFKIEGNKGAGWVELEGHHSTTFYPHDLANASMGESWQHRVTAYDICGNPSTVSDISVAKSPELLGSSCFQVDCIEIGMCIFTVAGTDNVIAMINASTEGGGTLKIAAKHIAISGSTSFESGYNPTTKVADEGGHYDSAPSGARVRIFPDAETGILVVDDNGDGVFRVKVGGADVGDVLIGSLAGQHVLWDKSAGQLKIEGILTASGIKTGTDNNRLELLTTGGYGTLKMYFNDNERLFAGGGTFWFKNISETMTCQIGSGGLWVGFAGVNVDCTGYIKTLDHYRVGTNPVVGGRGSVIANPTDPASTQARLIDVLDFLRGWGAIAS